MAGTICERQCGMSQEAFSDHDPEYEEDFTS